MLEAYMFVSPTLLGAPRDLTLLFLNYKLSALCVAQCFRNSTVSTQYNFKEDLLINNTYVSKAMPV